MVLEVQQVGRGNFTQYTLDSGKIAADLKRYFAGHVYKVGQSGAIKHKHVEYSQGGASAGGESVVDVPLKFTIKEYEVVTPREATGSKTGPGEAARGGGMSGGQFAQLLYSTEMQVRKSADAQFKLKGGSSSHRQQIFGKGFNFQALGVGGLDDEFQLIFRQAFASRLLPPSLIEAMGLNHVRGMLLYGPPGCGKTLIARYIGKALNAADPKVVQGPSILDKYVGESEKKIRELFEDAEKEQAEKGDESGLHIIIMDELDAICRKRGSVGGGTGVHDSIVNQLLSKIDGVDSLNNVLLIGMTNRKDMIDDALLRPGRLEVHVEIGLPSESGREYILGIHTAKLKTEGFLAPGVDLMEVAKRSKNFTGAELSRVVRNARSFAMARVIDPTDLSKAINRKDIMLGHSDFLRAVEETHPAFGVADEDIKALYQGYGIIDYSDAFKGLRETLRRLTRQLLSRESRYSLVTCCLSGQPGAGKTALAASVAVESGFPFVKRIGAEDLLSLPESVKAQRLHEAFEDAGKSPLSLLLLDDVDRMLEYVPVGYRFSNMVLQTLLVLLRRRPPQGHKLLVLATCSDEPVVEDLGLGKACSTVQRLPVLRDADELKAVIEEAVRQWAAEAGEGDAGGIKEEGVAASGAGGKDGARSGSEGGDDGEVAGRGAVMEAGEIDTAASELGSRPGGVPMKRLLALLEMARQAQADEDDAMAGADDGGAGERGPVSVTAAKILECALETDGAA